MILFGGYGVNIEMNLFCEIPRLLGLSLCERFRLIPSSSDVVVEPKAIFWFDTDGFHSNGHNASQFLTGLLRGEYVIQHTSDPFNATLQLCFVDDSVMYFTNDFANVDGVGWDDAYYADNADYPFESYVFLRLCFQKDIFMQSPVDFASCASVNEINRGVIPWLTHKTAGNLKGGATLDDTIKWLRDAKSEWAVLHY